MEVLQPIGVDASGYEILTKAVKALLNQFPGLAEGEEITFEELGEDYGIAFSADAGALVLSERRSITDHVRQTCQYPLLVIYRTNTSREFQKINVRTFLDTLGQWLCKEPAVIGDMEYRLLSYPELSGNRKITRITRNNAYGAVPGENQSQDWVLPVSIQYTNEFDM